MADSKLSKRQKECLKYVREGYTSKEIARILDISPSTVDNHIKAAISALRASGRADAARKIIPYRNSQKLTSQPQTLEKNRKSETIEELPERKAWKNFLIIPSLWGASPELKWTNKIYHIFQVCVLFSMSAVAIILLLAGGMTLLNLPSQQ